MEYWILEWWGFGKPITPTLHYSTTPIPLLHHSSFPRFNPHHVITKTASELNAIA